MACRARWILARISSPSALQRYGLGFWLRSARYVVIASVSSFRNDVNGKFLRDLAVDLIEEAQPVQMGVPLLSAVDQLAFQIAQRREQADPTVADALDPLGGQLAISAWASFASSPSAAVTRLEPPGVRQHRCSQMVWASSLRLSAGKVATVCWMSAIC